MMLNHYRDRAHSNSVKKGFWNAEILAEELMDAMVEDQGGVIYKLCETVMTYANPVRYALIQSEVSEALENDRELDEDFDEENHAEEMADILIRVFDYAGWHDLDLDAAVEKKMAKNESRPPMHGKAY